MRAFNLRRDVDLGFRDGALSERLNGINLFHGPLVDRGAVEGGGRSFERRYGFGGQFGNSDREWLAENTDGTSAAV